VRSLRVCSALVRVKAAYMCRHRDFANADDLANKPDILSFPA
jgi:hypothetical protein